MAKSKTEKPASRTIEALGFLRAPGGNVVVVRGLMDLGACESLSPRRIDADMQTRPMPHKTEPDGQGRVFTEIRPTLVKVGEHPVHGQRSDRTMTRAIEVLGVLLNRAMLGSVEDIATLEALIPPPKPPRKASAGDAARQAHSRRAGARLARQERRGGWPCAAQGRAQRGGNSAVLKERAA